MTGPLCGECGRPLGDGVTLCKECVGNLIEQLADVPALLAELAIVRAGLARSGPRSSGAGRPAEPPLPVRLDGRDRRAGERVVLRLETAVIGWARALAEDLHVCPAVGTAYLVDLTQERRLAFRADRRPDAAALAEPATPVEQCAIWLTRHRREIARHEAAPELAREVAAAVRGLRRAVAPPPREYLGLCPRKDDAGQPCGHELWAEDRAVQTVCRRCGAPYVVAELKSAALTGAEDRHYSVADLLRLLTELGHPVPRSTLYRWAQQRRIAPRGWQHTDERGTRITDHQISPEDRQVYRLGDALAVARKEGAEAV
ncbi:hypothetical protein [Nocardia sp. CA-290969]|uniref:hypothetical protein n=1 Tax=Nocardia sp. CA-290969 TaxID=3239986 RepID=UPI003D948DAF